MSRYGFLLMLTRSMGGQGFFMTVPSDETVGGSAVGISVHEGRLEASAVDAVAASAVDQVAAPPFDHVAASKDHDGEFAASAEEGKASLEEEDQAGCPPSTPGIHEGSLGKEEEEAAAEEDQVAE